MSFPFFDPRPSLDAVAGDVRAAVERVLSSGKFILGPEVEAFEAAFASKTGSKHAIGVNSGTDALIIALRAVGVAPGDEVLLPSFTFFATAEAVSAVGAKPVFVDVGPDLNLDVDDAAARVTARTRAIIPVHLFGAPCGMDAAMALAERHDLAVVEDVAQATGGTWKNNVLGSIGRAGAFSFFPTKNLAACGDGGIIITDDDAVAELARKLRAHGSLRKYANEMLGYNSRLDALQAAILGVRLGRLDADNTERRRLAARYREALQDVPGMQLLPEPEHGEHVHHQYTILVDDRDGVQQRMKEAGVPTMVYYPIPVHRLPVYAALGVELPATDAAARRVLSLPIYPGLSNENQDRVIEALKAATAWRES